MLQPWIEIERNSAGQILVSSLG